MTHKMIAIDFCEDCPYCFTDPDNDYEASCDAGGVGTVRKIETDIATVIPDWCPLENWGKSYDL